MRAMKQACVVKFIGKTEGKGPQVSDKMPDSLSEDRVIGVGAGEEDSDE